jgi:FtsP/CotA-like multicopper oxidase with cupredoxin domain
MIGFRKNKRGIAAPLLVALLAAAALLPEKSSAASRPDCYEELASENGVLTVDLNVTLEVSLDGIRTSPQYNKCGVGPTLRVKPGDTLVVNLHNNLPAGSDLDVELYQVTHDPNSDPVNRTIIANRLSLVGNQGSPAFGYYGASYMNLHFHGAGFPGSIENVMEANDGGGTAKTLTFDIPSDKPPGLFWYHNHFHGTSQASMMSGLYGFLVIEGTEYDITEIPELKEAGYKEELVILSEFLGDGAGTPVPDFPIVMSFNWLHLTNGQVGDNTTFEYSLGDVVLFRMVAAGVDPPMQLVLEGHNVTVVAMDGFVVPQPYSTDTVTIIGGQRVEFIVQFDTPGSYAWKRMPVNFGITGVEACNASFGIPAPSCISWDVERVVATVQVSALGFPTNSTIMPTLPDLPPIYQELTTIEPVSDRTVTFKMTDEFPLFQIPYDGPFVPPGVGFGIDDRFFTPHEYHGQIVAGTCERWHVVSDPPFAQHAFHSHAAPYVVTHEDGIPLDNPYWADTTRIAGHNVTIHICFDRLSAGDYQMIHCHQSSHQDIGVRWTRLSTYSVFAFVSLLEASLVLFPTIIADGCHVRDCEQQQRRR